MGELLSDTALARVIRNHIHSFCIVLILISDMYPMNFMMHEPYIYITFI